MLKHYRAFSSDEAAAQGNPGAAELLFLGFPVLRYGTPIRKSNQKACTESEKRLYSVEIR